MTGDPTRLPKWAQDHLARLEADLAVARERERARAHDGDSNTSVLDYTNGDWKLPPNARVVFTLPYAAADGRPADIEVHLSGRELQIRASGGPLIVRPHVSNQIDVSVEPR